MNMMTKIAYNLHENSLTMILLFKEFSDKMGRSEEFSNSNLNMHTNIYISIKLNL
jgi:hypothetical protein